MSKRRTSIKDNSPLSGLISEPETEENVVKQSSSQDAKQLRPRSDDIQQETLYLHPEQVIDLEELILALKRRNPRVVTSKSALARAAVDLLLAKDEDEIVAMLA